MKDAHTNRLIHARSPYLLQHAHNPVDWFEWGDEALEKAKKEDKLILVSIGYSACHWCHVMERESFENGEIAGIMNEGFVCIKVDREERPDIDQVYMDAVQALGVNGGWPLNVFLTPHQRPFFGGTYFSPQAWTHVLKNVMTAYRDRKDVVESTANTVTEHIALTGIQPGGIAEEPSVITASIKAGYGQLERQFDRVHGGFGQAPKFVMPSVWQFLLRYHHVTGSAAALNQTRLTLDRVMCGGIYDQAGGGFARYSVDEKWFAPHFEKMLYDNAQLISLYSETGALTGNTTYRQTVYDTIAWLEREMRHDQGGFYSALDADSEGEEGKFYIWSYEEFLNSAGPKAEAAAKYFSVIPPGNWEEGKNILTRPASDEAFAQSNGLTEAQRETIIAEARDGLLRVRSERIKPGCDDKILLAWNAMAISGLAQAYRAFAEPTFLGLALTCATFLETNLCAGDVLYRSWRGSRSATPGFLDDYAFYIKACVDLYQVTFDEKWVMRARSLTRYVLDHFHDQADGLFYFTSDSSSGLVVRKKELFDNVIPSSNAVMARNLLRLGILLDQPEWSQLAERMVGTFSGFFKTDLHYLTEWAIAALEMEQGFDEIAITGNNALAYRSEIQKEFLPFTLTMGKTHMDTKIPQLKEKEMSADRTAIYLCRHKTCQLPVFEASQALEQLRKMK